MSRIYIKGWMFYFRCCEIRSSDFWLNPVRNAIKKNIHTYIYTAFTYFDNRQPWASPACWRNSRWRWTTERHQDYGNPRRTPRCNCPSALRHRAATSGCSPWCPCRKSRELAALPCSASGCGYRSNLRCTCSCRWTVRTSECRPFQRLGVPRRPPRHIVS